MTTTMLDRVVRWNLDLDGDIYGDEHERFRWYEGLAVASSLQILLLPWVAAVLVWTLGRPAVLPLGVMLVAFQLPFLISTAYLSRRGIRPRTQIRTRKQFGLSVLSGLPLLLFVFGAVFAFRGPEGNGLTGAVIGGAIGGLVAVGFVTWETRRRRGKEAEIVEDEEN
ncbi:hypothetical protein OHA21_31930 [Actinoplanes sp. NBC_00393]|uniref:hypothetical protein n=1 Tax=Actinoplanes sp. NBC_00393 TaxID=2975953 RepID=UPI002E1BCD11